MKTNYLLLNETNLKSVSELMRAERDYVVKITNFTRTFKSKNYKILLNDTGEEDYLMLQMLSKVKRDIQNYKSDKFKKTKSDIFWYLVNQANVKDYKMRVYKVDLNSAYWAIAIKNGLISEDTDKFYKDKTMFMSDKLKKSYRLKALGMLATKKIIQVYEDNKMVSETIQKAETRDIYIAICEEVDIIMRRFINYAIYYYFDCLFIEDLNTAKFVMQQIKNEYGIDSKYKEDVIYLNFNEIYSFIYSEDIKNVYPADLTRRAINYLNQN